MEIDKAAVFCYLLCVELIEHVTNWKPSKMCGWIDL